MISSGVMFNYVLCTRQTSNVISRYRYELSRTAHHTATHPFWHSTYASVFCTWIGFSTVTRLRTISTVKRFTENSNSQEIKMLKKVEKRTARKHTNDVCSAVESSLDNRFSVWPINSNATSISKFKSFKWSAYQRTDAKESRSVIRVADVSWIELLDNKELTIDNNDKLELLFSIRIFSSLNVEWENI